MSSGGKIRLKGFGVPRGRGTRGDLYAIVEVAVPDRLSTRQQELLEQLRAEGL
jgi:curved DNA-binding protein